MYHLRTYLFLCLACSLCACGSNDSSHASPDPAVGGDAGSGADGASTADAAADSGSNGTVDSGSGAPVETDAGADSAAPPDGPLYFIAVHNEPWHFLPNGETGIASEYEVLRQMVAAADKVHVKLTLMFTPQWADYIVDSPARKSEVLGWNASGHEIAGHHHSVYHGNWDGYTNYSESEAIAMRLKAVPSPEPYLGTLEDYSAHLAALAPDIVSGCMNDEPDMRALPKSIFYDTCLGYANHGDDWMAEEDGATPDKGINEFLTVGQWDGVQRSWLTHYQITKPEYEAQAEQVFDGLTGGVYGVVLHSNANEAPQLYAYLSFLSERDPDGARSRTVREIVDSGVLPERTVPDELLESKLTPSGGSSPCGDGVCDDLEKANPTLCPQDCP